MGGWIVYHVLDQMLGLSTSDLENLFCKRSSTATARTVIEPDVDTVFVANRYCIQRLRKLSVLSDV